MIKTLSNILKQEKEKFKVPRKVQDIVPVRTIWPDGIFLVGKNKYSKMYRFEDINYAVASREDKLAYNLAIEEDLVGKNLMLTRRLAKRPKSNKRDKVVKGLTEDEQKRFLEALEEDRVPRNRNNYKAQLKLELYTGMRMGEINALKKEDVDFARGIIHVRRTISQGLKDRRYLKEGAKTETGTREIPINDLAKEVLKEAIKNAPRNKPGLIFFDTNKKNLITTQQVNCYFRRLCKKADIELRGQHALRHTFATRCIEAGVPAVVLKTWMGHTDIHITMDTYADVFNRMNNDAMKMFEDYAVSIAG